MVLLATPNAALSRSAVTHGSLAGSDRKLTCPSAYTTPAAHVARRPACSGEGRLRASFATARRPRSAYSSSRTDRHTESVMPTISSTTGRSPLGIFSSSSAITATPALLGHRGHGDDSIPRRFPRSRRPLPLLRRSDDLRLLPAKPLEVEVLDELRQRRLPRLLPVVADLAQLSRVQPEFAGHLHLRVREAVPLARLNPGPDLRRKSLLTFPIRTSPANDDRPRSIPRPQAAPAAGDAQRCSPHVPPGADSNDTALIDRHDPRHGHSMLGPRQTRCLADLGPPARLSRSTRHGPAVKFAVQEDSLRSRPNPGQRGGDRTDISSDDFLGNEANYSLTGALCRFSRVRW